MENSIYKIILTFILQFGSLCCFAEPATVLTGSILYEKPDFDSNPIEQLEPGAQIEVSKRKFGVFHRARLPSKKEGFVADHAITFGKLNTQNSSAENKEKSQQTSDKPRRPFASSRFRGVGFSYVNYREDTMSLKPTANMVFLGFKMVGPDLMVEGDMVTEVNLELSPTAPGFYQQATGNSASGWIAHADFLFSSQYPQSKRVLYFLGFGPMFKYSHYTVGLKNGAQTVSYNLDDMVLGAVFNAGIGFRIGADALRAEFKMNWEKMQYWQLGLSYLFSF